MIGYVAFNNVRLNGKFEALEFMKYIWFTITGNRLIQNSIIP